MLGSEDYSKHLTKITFMITHLVNDSLHVQNVIFEEKRLSFEAKHIYFYTKLLKMLIAALFDAASWKCIKKLGIS